MLAKVLGGSDVAVTLRQPAPLDCDLRIERVGEGAELLNGDDVIASAQKAQLSLDVPPPPSLAEARAAEERFKAESHIYPGCFVCGPERRDDGLCIFPGTLADGRVAAEWIPSVEFADDDGHVRPEFIWAALDCPGYFAVQQAAGLALLGRISVSIHHMVLAMTSIIVQGWSMGGDGRKHRAGTALHSTDGTLLAVAEQVWVTLKPA